VWYYSSNFITDNVEHILSIFLILLNVLVKLHNVIHFQMGHDKYNPIDASEICEKYFCFIFTMT
jgi:hypothetical protein